jgi:hypothetical protein
MAVTGNSARIETALQYRLRTLELDPVRRIAWADSAFQPIADEIYLEPGTLWNPTQRGEIGTRAPKRYVGIFQVLVHGPVLGDQNAQKEVADAIIEWFDRQVITRNDVTVRIGSFEGGRSVPWRGSSIVQGAWRLIPVSIPFWCDVFPT